MIRARTANNFSWTYESVVLTWESEADSMLTTKKIQYYANTRFLNVCVTWWTCLWRREVPVQWCPLGGLRWSLSMSRNGQAPSSTSINMSGGRYMYSAVPVQWIQGPCQCWTSLNIPRAGWSWILVVLVQWGSWLEVEKEQPHGRYFSGKVKCTIDKDAFH